jgi:hypothetical protein
MSLIFFAPFLRFVPQEQKENHGCSDADCRDSTNNSTCYDSCIGFMLWRSCGG